jgi:hypothetical protein
MNSFFNASGYPSTRAAGSSSSMRSELEAITAAFDKLPTLAGNGLKLLRVNAGGTAIEAYTPDTLALAAGSASAPSLSFTGDSNTGLWSPAADTVAISTAGVERMRVASGGEVSVDTGFQVKGAGNGSVRLNPGSPTRTGYYEFVAANGNRQGYIGFSDSTGSGDSGTLPYVAGLHSFTGAVRVSGQSRTDAPTNGKHFTDSFSGSPSTMFDLATYCAIGAGGILTVVATENGGVNTSIGRWHVLRSSAGASVSAMGAQLVVGNGYGQAVISASGTNVRITNAVGIAAGSWAATFDYLVY